MARILPFSTRRTRRRSPFAKIAGGALVLAAVAAASLLERTAGPEVAPSVAAAQEHAAGRPRVVDGDTLAFGEERVRILDIDAPEMDQSCLDAKGRAYACGEAATRALEGLAGEAEVRCSGPGRDVYGRMLARCEAGGRDLGAEMVRSGWAVIYRKLTDAYAAEEAAAEAAGAGMWAGRFDMPWIHRDGGGEVAREVAREVDVDEMLEAAKGPGECAIKGNVSGNGRIYHSPGQQHYERTRIDVSDGERWFCSAGEAEAAGWRPARR